MSLLENELNLWSEGHTHIVGVDEAGRGPLAGPIVVASVVLNKDHLFENSSLSSEALDLYNLINDSKKLTAKRRELLYDFIVENAVGFHIEEISHKKIDEWGIAKSNQIGFFNVIQNLTISYDHILTDHYPIRAISESKQTNIVRGDTKSISVAAASILAKVHRDRIMIKHHKKFPKYGFDKHKGYGTAFHRDQLLKHGPCEIHRRSFRLGFSSSPKNHHD